MPYPEPITTHDGEHSNLGVFGMVGKGQMPWLREGTSILGSSPHPSSTGPEPEVSLASLTSKGWLF
jgi:hypothetical protein